MGNLLNNFRSSDKGILIIELSSLISLIGSLFIMSCFLIITRLRSSYNKLIFSLGIANFLYSGCKLQIAFFLTSFKSVTSNDLICKIQASLMQYSFTSSTLLVLLISLNLYQIFINNSLKIQNNIIKFIILCFILPCFTSAFFIYEDSFLYSKTWCFLDMDSFYIEGTLMVHGVYLMSTLLMSFFYIRIFKRLKQNIDFSNQGVYKKVYNRVRWYPILLIVCFGPLVGIRQLMHFKVEVSDEVLDFAGVLASLNGFFNSIFYALNEKTQDAIRNFFCGGKDVETSLIDKSGEREEND